MKYKRKDIERHELQEFDIKYIHNPIIDALVLLFANVIKLHPITITLIGLVCGLISGFSFFKGYFILAIIFYDLRWIFDNVDGRLARLTNKGSRLGAFLDNYTGYLSDSLCILGLMIFYNSKIIYVLGFFIYMCWIMNKLMSSKYNSLTTKVTNLKRDGLTFLKIFYNRGLREPFNSVDQRMLIYIICPLLAFFGLPILYSWSFILIGMFLMHCVYIAFYINGLKKQDIKMKFIDQHHYTRGDKIDNRL